jgi:death-on-curing protein
VTAPIRYVTLNEVLAMYRELMDARGQQGALVAREKLESAVARPQTSAFGEDAYRSLAAKAAALL